MIVTMNVGIRLTFSVAALLVGLTGCAQWPGESLRAEVAPPPPLVLATPAKPPPVETSGAPAIEASTTLSPSPPSSTTWPTTPTTETMVVRAGECWVQTVIQPKPIHKPLEIVVRDAVNDIDVIPPTLELRKKEIIVREGGQTFRVEPPVYKKVVEKVMVRPEIRRSVVVPAVFEEREVQVEIEAARTLLERCQSSTARRTAEAPVQMLCAREVPAKTQTVKRKILIQPETTREVVEPAVYKEVTRWVLETPARAIPIELPARTANLKVQEITRPEQIEEQQVPAKVKRLQTIAYEGEPSVVLRRAVCDQDLNPKLVQNLQLALKQAGFDPGQSDGRFGRQTFRALIQYQRQHGLAQGALTYESLERLGVATER